MQGVAATKWKRRDFEERLWELIKSDGAEFWRKGAPSSQLSNELGIASIGAWTRSGQTILYKEVLLPLRWRRCNFDGSSAQLGNWIPTNLGGRMEGQVESPTKPISMDLELNQGVGGHFGGDRSAGPSKRHSIEVFMNSLIFNSL